MVINPIVGVYIPIVRIPIKGGMTIPYIATFDPGTYKGYLLVLGKEPETELRKGVLYPKPTITARLGPY